MWRFCSYVPTIIVHTTFNIIRKEIAKKPLLKSMKKYLLRCHLSFYDILVTTFLTHLIKSKINNEILTWKVELWILFIHQYSQSFYQVILFLKKLGYQTKLCVLSSLHTYTFPLAIQSDSDFNTGKKLRDGAIFRYIESIISKKRFQLV